jgi:WD40 repeat protein
VLLECFLAQPCLLVLDNVETLLQEHDAAGNMRPGYEDYAMLLRRVAQTPHQSCLLLTSRETPVVLEPLESSQMGVRTLRLGGLALDACELLFDEREIVSSAHDRKRLAQRYVGNPLALKIVAETIVELFNGEISSFLEQNLVIFSTLRDLLAEQWTRLSMLEQALLIWLTIVREPIRATELHELLVPLVAPIAEGQVREALLSLQRRSLVEQGKHPGTFTLQSVVLEYVTEVLVERVSQQVMHTTWKDLISYALAQAGAKEYVRQAQERMLVAPILLRLQTLFHKASVIEERLLELLNQLRTWDQQAQGYGPANLIALLHLLRGHLRGLDLSHLALRGVSLQCAEMQDANLSCSLISESVFRETFDVITAVAISSDGRYWAAVGKRGEVRVWKWEKETGQILHLIWQAHIDATYALSFSPDGRTLASGSWDDTIKLWDVASGALLWSSWHPNGVQSLAIAPDGGMLATGGNDATVKLWDLRSGVLLQTLPHPCPILSVAWSPDGCMLATGGFNGQIQLWVIQNPRTATCVGRLAGHTNRVLGLAFAPDGSTLASASWDGAVKLWGVANHCLRQTLVGHTDRVNRVVWSPDGHTLASGGWDSTIWLWDSEEGSYRTAMQGHTASVNSLTFMPDNRSLLSGSDDNTLRLWDIARGQCTRVMQGYAASLFDVDWSPDGTQLVSAGSDALVLLWDVSGRASPRVLHKHRGIVYGVGWSPNGRWLASSAWDDTISLWDMTTGTLAQALRDPDNPKNIFRGVAWSPDGRLLASGSYQHGVQVWDMMVRRCRWVGSQLSTKVRHLVWSPDGTRLVGGGDDGHIYLWDASDGTLLQRLAGHQGDVTSVDWSPDGTRLTSAGRCRGSSGGELLVWEAESGACVQVFAGQPDLVSAVTWDQSGALMVSGGCDGLLRWWEVKSGKCLQDRQAHEGTIWALKKSPDGRLLASVGDDGAIRIWDIHTTELLRTLRRDRPYERLNITGIQGLTEAQKATLRALGATP